ncbi:MAG: sugar ABC transporter permease [Rhodobacteraceae bacterium]|jgi:glucose/mannose transport system permease protein|nr:sugar ABC transporter permease [Paracoccaceae bacterium]
MSVSKRPNFLFQNLASKIASIPMILTAVVIFVGCTLWTVAYSFTGSRLLPRWRWVGLDQYERLWETDRWMISINNLILYGVLMMLFSLALGFLLAALLDQKIRGENVFRTIFLYPYALSFVVTGLTWQWLLNPDFGVQKLVRDLGWSTFEFAPLTNNDWAIYGVLLAGLWQGSGLVMVLMLAGLRGIDQDVWKAARVDGISTWKTYIFIVLPMMRPIFVTAVVLVATGIIKIFDLIVAQTDGGPGLSTEVPAKYVYDMMFSSQNLGQGFAASTTMLLVVLVIIIPWSFYEFGGRRDAK